MARMAQEIHGFRLQQSSFHTILWSIDINPSPHLIQIQMTQGLKTDYYISWLIIYRNTFYIYLKINNY